MLSASGIATESAQATHFQEGQGGLGCMEKRGARGQNNGFQDSYSAATLPLAAVAVGVHYSLPQ
jgi:hypothetical protein